MSERLGLAEIRDRATDPERVASLIGVPVNRWVGNCHSVSLRLVRSGWFGAGRVARGTCQGVGSQHSWMVAGQDCYDQDAVLIDATREPGKIITGKARDLPHRPHGKGSIWSWGQPAAGGGPVIELTPRRPLSRMAAMFLDMLGPLDREGWAVLAHAPVEGWPAGEIIEAMCDTERLRQMPPLDIVGMVTSRNPGGVYLAGESDSITQNKGAAQ